MSKKTNKIQTKDQVAVELSPEHRAALENVVNIANASMKTGQEMLLAIEQILEQDFNFSEKDLGHVEQKLMRMLQTLATLERKGLSILSPNDMSVVGEIATAALQNEINHKSGLILPPSSQKGLKSN